MTAIAFLASPVPEAERALGDLTDRYGNCPPDQADVIVALGGDGFMLQCLHTQLGRDIPIYGMNLGTIGFLMNALNHDGLEERLAKAERASLHPLRMIATDAEGKRVEALAINEISLLRETRQAAKIAISIDGRVRLPELICDGVLSQHRWVQPLIISQPMARSCLWIQARSPSPRFRPSAPGAGAGPCCRIRLKSALT